VPHIFISHASSDDGFVKELRVALESLKLPVWVDSRNLCGGNKLAPEIERAIEDARQVIVVLSPNTVNSPWVRREIAKAIEVERRKKDEAAALEVERSQKEDATTVGTQASAGELGAQASDGGLGEQGPGRELGVQDSARPLPAPATSNPDRANNSTYRVISLLLPGIEPSALALWFDGEPLGILVQVGPGGLSEALPQILAALGEQMPDDFQPAPGPPGSPVARLKLKLRGPSLSLSADGKSLLTATGQLIYSPDPNVGTRAEAQEFKFTAPLGPIEATTCAATLRNITAGRRPSSPSEQSA
jgi:hypothetical protein